MASLGGVEIPMTEKKVVEQPEGEFSDIWFHIDYLYEEEEEKKSEQPYTIALIDESLGLDRWTFILEKAKKGRGHWRNHLKNDQS